MSGSIFSLRLRRASAVVVAAMVGALAGVSANGCLNGPANCSTGEGVYEGEGRNMSPGGDCIACHSQGEGPRYLIAGTVMGKANDDENCAGISSVTVQITDATGRQITLDTTSDGNFYYGGGEHHTATQPLMMPYNAKVIRNGKERVMVAAQSDGNCATCHTAEGANGAPGRILAP